MHALISDYHIFAFLFIHTPLIFIPMARFKSSTFGKISGKYGTAVAAIRKDGLNILKEYRAASNPNTTKQKNQRGKFGFVVRELNCMRRIFTITFGGQYGINRAASLAMKTALTGEFPDFRLDYSQLIISNGTLKDAAQVGFEQLNERSIKLNWNADIFLGGNSTDNLNLVFLNQTSKTVVFKQNQAIRSEGTVIVELPDIWVGKDIQCWLYLTSTDGSLCSTSQYICQFQL